MASELKFRIHDLAAVEERLEELGGRVTSHLHVIDTYFNQPPGQVLKISHDESGVHLVRLRRDNGGFEILENRKLEPESPIPQELEAEFGVKVILEKKRVLYEISHKNYSVNLNLISGVGDFLIVESEGVDIDLVCTELNLSPDDQVTESFDELKLRLDGRELS